MTQTAFSLRICIALAMLACGVAQVRADDSTIKDNAKQVGHEVGTAVRQVGQEAKKVGKAVKKTAKEGVQAMKEGGKEFKRAVKGESSDANRRD